WGAGPAGVAGVVFVGGGGAAGAVVLCAGAGGNRAATGHIAWPARIRARPCAREALRSAGEGVRASRASSRVGHSPGRWHVAAVKAAVTRPVVASLPRRKRARPATSRTRP